MQLHAGREQLMQALTAKLGIFGELRHAACVRHITDSGKEHIGISIFQGGSQILRNGLFIVEVVSSIKGNRFGYDSLRIQSPRGEPSVELLRPQKRVHEFSLSAHRAGVFFFRLTSASEGRTYNGTSEAGSLISPRASRSAASRPILAALRLLKAGGMSRTPSRCAKSW